MGSCGETANVFPLKRFIIRIWYNTTHRLHNDNDTIHYVLTSSLLSTSTPLSNNNFTTCKWPVLAALHSKEIIHYNNQEMTHM